MKVWITRYALTVGIQYVDAEVVERHPTMVKYGSGWFAHGEGKEWHLTYSAAVDRAEKMRTAKIASLQKSIKKLEKLTFGNVADNTETTAHKE